MFNTSDTSLFPLPIDALLPRDVQNPQVSISVHRRVFLGRRRYKIVAVRRFLWFFSISVCRCGFSWMPFQLQLASFCSSSAYGKRNDRWYKIRIARMPSLSQWAEWLNTYTSGHESTIGSFRPRDPHRAPFPSHRNGKLGKRDIYPRKQWTIHRLVVGNQRVGQALVQIPSTILRRSTTSGGFRTEFDWHRSSPSLPISHLPAFWFQSSTESFSYVFSWFRCQL